MVFVVLYPGAPEGSNGSGPGFKASQKTGPPVKSNPTDWEKPGTFLFYFLIYGVILGLQCLYFLVFSFLLFFQFECSPITWR